MKYEKNRIGVMIFEQFGVEAWMDRYEEEARFNITDTCAKPMTLNECFTLIGEDKSAFMERFFQKEQTYGTILGASEVKEAIAKLYKTISEDQILTHHGATGANQHIMYALLRPGDRVIAFTPSYQQFYSTPRAIGCQIQVLRLRKENGYLPDLDELREATKRGVRLICLNNPNNPTGSIIPDDMMKEIVEIARTCGAYILCDEVYEGVYIREGETVTSICDLYEKGISTCSMSKAYSLAGLRLGWMATRDEKAIAYFKKVRDYDIVSCGLFDEAVAALALNHHEKILERNCKIIRENLPVLADWVKKEESVSFVKPVAGTMALVYYDLDLPSEIFCRRMYYETGAFNVPGDCFDEPHSFRVGYAHEKEGLIKGLAAVSEFLEKLRSEGAPTLK